MIARHVMPDVPTLVQLLLVATAAVLVAAGTAVSVAGRRRGAVGLPVAGLAVALVAQALHAARRGDWLPLEDNFDALLWLAISTGAVTLYLRRQAAVPRIDVIAGPIVALLMVGAAVFGRTRPREYNENLWSWGHGLIASASTVAFALAACAGVLYLVLRNKLREKHFGLAGGPPEGYGSLERLERLNYSAVSVGFALLTVGLVSGVAYTAGHRTTLGDRWFLAPKVLLSFAAYVVYAVVLHGPINPAVRGKRTAVLSIAGFVLLLGTLVAVQR